MTRVYLSLGSNIDRERNICSAVAALRRQYGPLEVSSVYETEAVGFRGDAFYNLVLGFDTDQSPTTVTQVLREIENGHGRVRGGEKFAARTLDIDLLTWGDEVLRGQGLNVPRDEILKYAFVLGPLAELAPDRTHPELGRSFAALWAEFAGGDAAALRRVDLELG